MCSCRACSGGCGWDCDTTGPCTSDPHRLVQCGGLGRWLTLSPGPAGCADWCKSSVFLQMNINGKNLVSVSFQNIIDQDNDFQPMFL